MKTLKQTLLLIALLLTISVQATPVSLEKVGDMEYLRYITDSLGLGTTTATFNVSGTSTSKTAKFSLVGDYLQQGNLFIGTDVLVPQLNAFGSGYHQFQMATSSNDITGMSIKNISNGVLAGTILNFSNDRSSSSSIGFAQRYGANLVYSGSNFNGALVGANSLPANSLAMFTNDGSLIFGVATSSALANMDWYIGSSTFFDGRPDMRLNQSGLFSIGTGTTTDTATRLVLNLDSPAANAIVFRIKTSDDTSRFSVDEDGDVAMDGALTVTLTGAFSGNLSTGGDLFTTGTGDDLWLGNSTQASALLKAYANGDFIAASSSTFGTTTQGPSVVDIYGRTGMMAFRIASATGTSVFEVENDGKVGVGTSTPGNVFTVVGTSSADCFLVNGSSACLTSGSGGGATTTINGFSGPSFTFATGTATGIGMNITGSGSTITFTPTVTSGYEIPLTASTTNWNGFYNTPSTRIGDGTGLTWSTNTLNCDTASGSVQGCLSAADWTTFNGKQAAGNYITALTGDVTATGPGSVGATLATVNGNVGSFGGSTAIPNFTVNAKGLITAAGTSVVIAPAGTLTGTTLASNVVTSSLTSVGTIGTGVWQGTPIGVTYGGTGTSTAPTLGQVLLGNASGGYNLVSTSSLGISGGGTPAGSQGNIQFNNAGAFGASSTLTYNNILGTLGIGTTTPDKIFTITGDQSGGIFKIERFNAGTNVSLSTVQIKGRSTGGMVNGFGTNLQFIVQGATSSEFSAGLIGSFREDADNTHSIVFQTANAGTLTEKMRITAAGNVGIGTSTPGSLLTVNGTTTASCFLITGSTTCLTASTGGTWNIVSGGLKTSTSTDFAEAGYFRATTTSATSTFAGNLTVGTNQLFVQANGNVGIGTTSPRTMLEVGNYNITSPVLTVRGGSPGFFQATVDIIASYTGNGANYPLRVRGNNGSQELFIVASNGNVGFGVLSPQSVMHLYVPSTAESVARFTNTTTGLNASDGFVVGVSNSGSNATINNMENASIIFATNNTPKMTILSTGLVGIATTTPLQTLAVVGTSSANPFAVYDSTSAPLFYILNGGNIGVGTTTPVARMHIINPTSGGVGTGLTVTNAGNEQTVIETLSATAYTALVFKQAGTTKALFGLNGSAALTPGAVAGDFIIRTNTSGSAIRFSSNVGGNETLTMLPNQLVGIASSTPSAMLTVGSFATSSYNNIFSLASSSNALLLSIDGNGSIITGGSGTPTLSSCGVTPTIVGNDTSGTITVGGGGSVTSCTLTFAVPKSSLPRPFVQSQQLIGAFPTTVSTTQIVVSFSLTMASSSFTYFIVQ